MGADFILWNGGNVAAEEASLSPQSYTPEQFVADNRRSLKEKGGDVEAPKTLRFDPERKTVVVEDRAFRPWPD